MKGLFIVAAKRTPVGGFLGQLQQYSAPQLGSIAIEAALKEAGVSGNDIDSVYMGHVLTAGAGQSPARQAARGANIRDEADATTVNKVCASGLKATLLGAQQIQLGIDEIVVTGGMESMSNVPHYIKHRGLHKLGDEALQDGVLLDGLTDTYDGKHMGRAAEICVREFKLTREEQDAYAVKSYQRAVAATEAGKFSREVVPVVVNNRKSTTKLSADEDIYKLVADKVPQLKPAFEEGGSITAANASNLNDGAAALVLASAEAVEKFKLKPLAKIISYADAAQEPVWFTTAPSVAIPKALERAGLTKDDIDQWEMNEAYAAVVLANCQLLGISPEQVNLYGGAVSMGHPIGVSGARILTTLISVLHQEGGKYGVAAICNGGGGASAIVIEKI